MAGAATDTADLDEPTPRSTWWQQEIMAQISELQRELAFSVLFITHEIS